MRDISFTKFAQNYFSGHVSWHGHTSAQQSNSAEFSSVSQTHFQSQKRTLSSVFPNPLAAFWVRCRTVWSMQQLANLVKSQTCKESHVHDNVLVFLPNCEYTYQKAFSDLLKICTFSWWFKEGYTWRKRLFGSSSSFFIPSWALRWTCSPSKSEWC